MLYMKQVDTIPYIAENLLERINEARRIRREEPMSCRTLSQDLPRVRRAETEFLEKCSACYGSLLQIHDNTKGNGNEVSQDVHDRVQELRKEHLERRMDFEVTVLRRGSFLNGEEMGELGRAYMGRCYGGMRDQKGLIFLCPAQILMSYISNLRIKPPEEPPQGI